MKTLGELIDAVMASEYGAYVQTAVNDTPSAEMVVLRNQPLNDEMVCTLCVAVADEFRIRLDGISTDELYMVVKGECQAFFSAVWAHVESLGILRESVFVPITITDMMKQFGLVDVIDGKVHLTDKGNAAADQVEREIKNS